MSYPPKTLFHFSSLMQIARSLDTDSNILVVTTYEFNTEFFKFIYVNE